MLVGGKESAPSHAAINRRVSRPQAQGSPPTPFRRNTVMKPVLRPLAALLAAVTFTSPAAAAPTTWKVDPAHTQVGFEVRHFFSPIHGVFHDSQGTIVFDEQDPSAIKVDATARAAS